MNNDLFTLFTARLESVRIAYMVTGSVASMIYGEPRLTHDVDLVVTLDDAAILALPRAFPDEDFYCAPPEVIRVEARRTRRGHFNIIHHETGFKADIYVAGRDPLHAWAMARRRRLPFGDTVLYVAPPEYVIVRKLEFFKEGGSAKHLVDIRAMLRESREQIDLDELRRRIADHDLEAAWAQVECSG